jgi:hypothetical protein
VLCSVGDWAVAKLIFPRELKEGRLRFPSRKDSKTTNYRVAILGDRRCIRILPGLGKIGAVIPMPVQSRRKRDLFAYNYVIRPSLRLLGIKSRSMLPNHGKSIRSVVFDEFCSELDIQGPMESFVEETRKRLVRSVKPVPRTKNILVHLFRQADYRMLREETLERIAQSICAELPKRKIVALYRGDWEKGQAEHFAASCRRYGSECEAVSLPLKDVATLASSSFLFVGVDHGISHLASLLCTRSIVIYGGSRRKNDMHLLWPPQIEGEMKPASKNISVLKGDGRMAVLVHPSREEYLAHPKEDPMLINSIVTYDTVRKALRLAKEA